MNTIGEIIARLRKERSMTQEEFASVLGVSPQSVSKWENSITMPDIMLLPVIAGIFDITIDELFYGKREYKVKTCTTVEQPEQAYMAVLEAMQKTWNYGSEDMSESVICEEARKIKNSLADKPQNNTGIVSPKSGAVYANKDMALSYLRSKADSLPMLTDERVGDFLSAVADEAFRKILKYQLENPSLSFTVSSVCAKCGVNENDAKRALDKLVSYAFLHCQSVDTGTDELLSVYHLYGEHKMPLMFYPLLALAERLAEFRDSWNGLIG